jgi:hypothetical protein
VIPGGHWIRSCPLAEGGVLEVEILGPGTRLGSVRLRSTNLRRGRVATWEIDGAILARQYVRGALLHPRRKMFGGARPAC